MILTFFSAQGWESWDVEHRPLIPEGMPVLVDDDLCFEDGPAAPRPAAVVNRWLRELLASGAPAPNTWELLDGRIDGPGGLHAPDDPGFAAGGGTLAAGVAELAEGRNYHPQRYRRPLPYGEAEWHRLTTTCRTLVEESYATHRRALAAAAGGTRQRAGGRPTTCASCWPASARSASPTSARPSACRSTWSTSAAASTTPPGTSSPTWT